MCIRTGSSLATTSPSLVTQRSSPSSRTPESTSYYDGSRSLPPHKSKSVHQGLKKREEGVRAFGGSEGL